jgi:hypothetical protein
MILFAVLFYVLVIVDMAIKITTRQNVEFDLSISKSLLFGASFLSDIDDDDIKYNCIQVAFLCFVATLTYNS